MNKVSWVEILGKTIEIIRGTAPEINDVFERLGVENVDADSIEPALVGGGLRIRFSFKTEEKQRLFDAYGHERDNCFSIGFYDWGIVGGTLCCCFDGLGHSIDTKVHFFYEKAARALYDKAVDALLAA